MYGPLTLYSLGNERMQGLRCTDSRTNRITVLQKLRHREKNAGLDWRVMELEAGILPDVPEGVCVEKVIHGAVHSVYYTRHLLQHLDIHSCTLYTFIYIYMGAWNERNMQWAIWKAVVVNDPVGA